MDINFLFILDLIFISYTHTRVLTPQGIVWNQSVYKRESAWIFSIRSINACVRVSAVWNVDLLEEITFNLKRIMSFDINH